MTPDTFERMGFGKYGFSWQQFASDAVILKSSVESEYTQLQESDDANKDEYKRRNQEIHSFLHAASIATLFTLLADPEEEQPIPADILTLPDEIMYRHFADEVIKAWDALDQNTINQSSVAMKLLGGDGILEVHAVPVYKPTTALHAIINGNLRQNLPLVRDAIAWLDTYQSARMVRTQRINIQVALAQIYTNDDEGGSPLDQSETQC